MTLDYLDFDCSEDEQGVVTWDAMASVRPDRVPALLAELAALLQWANRRFTGRCGPLEEGGDWDVDLQAQDDAGDPLAVHWDAASGSVTLVAASQGRSTVSLSLSGTPQFALAMREAWQI